MAATLYTVSPSLAQEVIMFTRVAATVLVGAAIVTTTLSAQAGKSTWTKSVMHEVTITADKVYTGTMEMAVESGKVTGKLRLTSPTGITGMVAGTAKAGALALEFPFHMTDDNCDGTVKMNITLPATPGPAKGTMEAVGCGRDESNKVTGTVELKPVAMKTPAGQGGVRF
jgi:hypothetical protein